ncbi:MAG: MarP family serine protease [Actinomycetota bacterium]
MNALDVAVVVAALAAGIGGWRLGFIARLFAWAGVALGLVVGVAFVPRVITAFGGTNADDRVTVAVLFLLLLATIGQALGLGIGVLVHRFQPDPKPLPRWDRAAGTTLGVLGVLVLVWMVIPSLATAKGWPARMARGSAVVAALEQLAPDQPDQFAAWGRTISDAPYPSALSPLDDPPDPGIPPELQISAAVDERVRQSVVKVTGRACRQIQEGSGWLTPDGLVVTNAHVIAGEDTTTVEEASGVEHEATAVAFDPVRDLAVLTIDDMGGDDVDAPGLRLGSAQAGDVGAVYGHPGGGELRAAPAGIGEEILAVGTDIYRTGESRRQVYVLAAALAPGDSGAAFVNREGLVVGVAFAIDPGRDATAYAVTEEEVQVVLDAVTPDGVDTGKCLTG